MLRATSALLYSVRMALGAAALVLAAWYAALVWIHARILAAPEAWWVAGAAGLTALAFLGCGLRWLRRPPPERLVDVCVAGIAFTVLANDALYVFLFPDPQYLHAQAAVLIGGGLFLTSSAWFAALASGVAAAVLMTLARSHGDAAWAQPSILLATSGALAVVIHIWRGAYLKRLEALSLEGEARRLELEHNVRALEQEVAEREQLQARLVKAQNLESLGRMAGGVAHDFNNLLMIIMGHAELVCMDLPPDATARTDLEEVMGAAERASLLTSQLLSYAGRCRVRLEPLDLNEVVRGSIGAVRAALPPGTSLVVDLAPGDLALEGDSRQLQETVVNLLVNAGEALPEGGGEIRVSTSVQDLEASEAEKLEPSGRRSPGHYACLEVRDTGCGIAAGDRPQIFDPFFTTKPQGRGLGLAAALGIARSHGGGFSIEPAPGRGSCFRLFLPALQGTPQRQAQVPGAMSLAGKIILVVDDEGAIRRFARRALEDHGCRVLEAANGDEAVEAASQGPAVDAVLLDMTMPGRSSRETFGLLREARPSLPVLLTSGYEVEQAAQHLVREPHVGFIQKPYFVDELVATLGALIHGAVAH